MGYLATPISKIHTFYRCKKCHNSLSKNFYHFAMSFAIYLQDWSTMCKNNDPNLK